MTFTCFNGKFGLILAAFVTISVGQELLVIPSDRQYKGLGESLLFPCEALNLGSLQYDANLRWFKDGVEISDTVGRIYVERTGPQSLRLYMNDLQIADAGMYTCRGDFEGNQDEREVMLDIHYKPHFDKNHPTEFYLWAGKTQNVTCMAQAEPEPVIKWYKDGKELATNEIYRIYPMGKNSNLQITCREEDQDWVYGFYKCSAMNPMGMGDMEMEVKRASLPGAPSSAHVLQEYPTSLLINVSVPDDDGGVPISGYSIEYEFHSFMFHSFIVNTDVVVGEVFLMENLAPCTRYMFRIHARNEVGTGPARELTHTTPSLDYDYDLVPGDGATKSCQGLALVVMFISSTLLFDAL